MSIENRVDTAVLRLATGDPQLGNNWARDKREIGSLGHNLKATGQWKEYKDEYAAIDKARRDLYDKNPNNDSKARETIQKAAGDIVRHKAGAQTGDGVLNAVLVSEWASNVGADGKIKRSAPDRQKMMV
jgi:hypothetical protein